MRAPAACVSAVVTALSLAAGALAAPIYTCIDPSGKRRTSDRPIPECSDREQRELNADGSLKRIVPPTLTADERAAKEAREAEEALARANLREAIRHDRNLLMRYPDEAAHRKARESALEDMRKALRTSESRLERLQKERKPLMDEAEFYVGRTMPLKLKQQIEGNDVATEAQRSLVLTQQAELVRINNLYDVELERLRQLWAGARPGTLGRLNEPAAAASAPPRRPAL